MHLLNNYLNFLSLTPSARWHCSSVWRCIKNNNLGKTIICNWLIGHLSYSIFDSKWF